MESCAVSVQGSLVAFGAWFDSEEPECNQGGECESYFQHLVSPLLASGFGLVLSGVGESFFHLWGLAIQFELFESLSCGHEWFNGWVFAFGFGVLVGIESCLTESAFHRVWLPGLD